MPRDYLHGHYAVFVGNDYRSGTWRDAATIETALWTNVYPLSAPDLAATGDDLLMVWVYDDPARTPVNRSEIVYSEYDSVAETWTEPPVAVADDGTADFHPQMAVLPSGNALLAWENVSEVLIEPGEPGDPCIVPCEDECAGEPDPAQCEEECQYQCKLDETKSKLEIAAALYDAGTGQWGAATAITSNGYIDRSPRIATASNGTAMLTWASNADDDPTGSTATPNDVHYATYDGTNWSAAGSVATGVPSITRSTMAYDGANALLLFIGDTDDDDDTLDDRELFAVEYAGGSWGTVTQLTSDTVQDANPQVAYDPTGTLLLVWQSDRDIVMATDLSLSDRHTIVEGEPDIPARTADFRLTLGASGHMGLVWQSASDDLTDMWSATYDPVLQVWTKPMFLTTDDSMERNMSPAFDETGDLLVAYNKVETTYETQIITVGEELIEFEMPGPGQADLYLLRHTISGDLSVNSNGVALSPPNPMAGQTATITANVKNLGDVPAVDLEAGFYDGDPGSGGTLIDIATNGGVLVGGDDVELSVQWIVPDSTEPHEVYIVVDPDLEQEDGDRTNNTVIMPGVMKPDAVISSILVQNAGPDRVITVRVANEGALPVPAADVTLRRDAADGELLTTLYVTAPIAAGAYRDVSWVWEDIAPIPGGVIEVFVIVDEADAIDEFDEDNNARSALVKNQPSTHPGDWDEDGDVDIDDFGEFPACLSGPWEAAGFIMPSQDCLDVFDFDADADVDLRDFAAFQEVFGES